MASLEDRIVELETRVAFQEDTLVALDAVIARQSDTIDQLERANRELYRRLEDLMQALESGSRPQEEKPPPHY